MTGCGHEHLVMYCTSHTLNGQQVLIEWSDCTAQEVHRGGYIAMILTSNMATTGKRTNLTLKVAN